MSVHPRAGSGSQNPVVLHYTEPIGPSGQPATGRAIQPPLFQDSQPSPGPRSDQWKAPGGFLGQVYLAGPSSRSQPSWPPAFQDAFSHTPAFASKPHSVVPAGTFAWWKRLWDPPAEELARLIPTVQWSDRPPFRGEPCGKSYQHEAHSTGLPCAESPCRKAWSTELGRNSRATHRFSDLGAASQFLQLPPKRVFFVSRPRHQGPSILSRSDP